MEYTDKKFTLEVWGPLACFTRPEMKVERVSYDVITPSAARAIFEAIFWKPAIRWQVTKIEVLNEIRWISVMRNEVGALASERTMKPIVINDKRQQRHSLMLRDVRYRLTAKLVFIPMRDRKLGDTRNPDIDKEEAMLLHRDENPGKYNAMFERRASKGQCFYQPYLGTRECAASFRLVHPEIDKLDAPIHENRDLGIMLYDMDFAGNAEAPDAMFYRAKMEDGVILVPNINSKEVLK
jgi:CRISPR-associated protein Cas5d